MRFVYKKKQTCISDEFMGIAASEIQTIAAESTDCEVVFGV